ncbi:sigma-70 family RNA polymerase sigma factor [Paenibacillus sp. CAA11]|uniref:RNA polymerase sigma factor n=1 Tax=Paenibacillus sp. CAA11 TaxID=1532905 RepID=UPI000D3B52E2|nr:sigma-70 family RNA polymerase sigma factor [Paenibacillus sp. CAA11]AWB43443.1 sigma-70 family RNA polymerase sigma factor [Paenibacillus sp. CAA11]
MCSERISEGACIEELCNEYYVVIYKYCMKLIRGQKELLSFAEECTQNTFLEACKQFSNLKSHPNIRGWLFCTAKNMINHSFRCMYLQQKRESSLHENTAIDFHYTDPQLENLLEEDTNFDLLSQEILDHLHPFEYEIYCDYYINKMSIATLSVKYQMTESAITTRIYRIRKSILHRVQVHFRD